MAIISAFGGVPDPRRRDQNGSQSDDSKPHPCIANETTLPIY